MPSRISYQTWSEGSGVGDPQELVGFCSESPVEVLREVYQTHLIHNYKELYRPVDWDYPNNISGLDIIEGEAPAGTTITGSLKDLNLDRAKAKAKDLPRTEQTYRGALKTAIKWHLNNHHGRNPTNYLDTREQEKNEDLEKYIPQLLEVAQITLGIKNPTIENLKKVLREN